jgi:hypothetical protein
VHEVGKDKNYMVATGPVGGDASQNGHDNDDNEDEDDDDDNDDDNDEKYMYEENENDNEENVCKNDRLENAMFALCNEFDIEESGDLVNDGCDVV